MILPLIQNKGKCTGCTACLAVCPVQCITMKQDDEGFLYPHVEEARCLHCKKCEKVCPQKSGARVTGQSEGKPYVLACAAKSTRIWRESASGGGFTAVCEAFSMGEEVYICGATWEGFAVKHKIVYGIKQLGPLRKSKYVSSDMGHVINEIRDLLQHGNKVVFAGTPCQVAGVRQAIENSDDCLLLIDLICHGVGSPSVFETCISIIQRSISVPIQSYEFRAKRRVFETDYMSSVQLVNGKKVYIQNDPYMQLFFSQDSLRPCCGENCKYRNEDRQGDITLSDFRYTTRDYPHLVGTKKNYTAVIGNSSLGKHLIRQLDRNKYELHPADIELIKEKNPLFWRQTWFSKNRDAFFAEYKEDPQKAISKCTKPMQISKKRLKRWLVDILPVWIRKVIFRLIIDRSRY